MALLETLPPLLPSSVLLLTSTALLLWYSLYAKVTYWSRRGIPNVNIAKCLFRTLHFTFGQKHFVDIYKDHYTDLEGHPHGGAFQAAQPALILRDPAIVKEVLIKSFSSFHDRGPTPNVKHDQLSGNIFRLTGDRWHQVRQKMAPAFSSAKMKLVCETLTECAHELEGYLQKLCSETGAVELDVKDLMASYTMEVIGACAMGVKCRSISDPECEFKKMVKRVFKFDLRRAVHMLLESVHPKLPKWFGLKAVDPVVEQFWLSTCKEVIRLKMEDKSSSRKDFLQILMDGQSGKVGETSENIEEPAEGVGPTENIGGPVLTEHVMTGVISTFLSAGFEPVSAALTFCFYELALHPEIQQKILVEVQTVHTGDTASMSCEDLKKCQYVEQVINETLRKYPVVGVIRRVCTVPFKLPDSSVVVEKNTKIYIPTHSLQHNPKYFPEPSKFDPDRFSKENIDNIVPGSYLPFSDGPRFCIARRFALMNIKKMVLTMVSNYKLHPCSKTPSHIEFDPSSFTLSPKGGLWLRLEKRR